MKRFFANCALMVFSLLLSALAVEMALRLYMGERVFASVNYVNRALDIVRTNSTTMIHDSTLGWVLKDDIDLPDAGMTTTAMGVRNNARASAQLPRRAVVAVGDSFTAGALVRDSETWPAQLEALLGRPVINGGVSAYGVDQMVLRAERLAEAVEPEAIVVGVLSQSNLRNAYDVFGGGFKPWFEIVGGEPQLRGVPVPPTEKASLDVHWTRRVFGYSFAVHHFMTQTGRTRWWVDDASRYRRVMSNEKGVEVTCALMRRLEVLRARHGTRIIVVVFWGAQEAALDTPPWYGPPVVDCATRAGFGVLDLHGELNRLSKDPGTYPQYWVDEGGVLGHPAALGHALSARLLKERFFPQ